MLDEEIEDVEGHPREDAVGQAELSKVTENSLPLMSHSGSRALGKSLLDHYFELFLGSMVGFYVGRCS